jgi:hypothetical protein
MVKAKNKNTAGDFETMRRNQSIRPLISKGSIEGDPLTNQIKDIDKIINLNMKIKQLENSGMKDMANEIREANGIKSSNENKKADSDNYKMLMSMWMSETDEVKKEQLQKMMMMENMKSGGTDSMNQMMFMTMMSPNQKDQPKKSEIETLLLQSTLNQLTNQMGKDPIESLVKYQDMMGKLNTGQGELASFLDSLEKGKQMGLVGENSPTIEDRKLSLEEKRLDNEMELKKLENDREAGTKSDTVNALTSIASSFLQSKTDGNTPSQPKQDEPKIEHIDGQCATCNNKISFTHPEESRDITCANCDEKYHWDSDKQTMEYTKDPNNNESPI